MSNAITIPKEFDKDIYNILNDVDNMLYFQWNLKSDILKFTSSVKNADYDFPQIANPASTFLFGGDFIHPEDSAEFNDFLDKMFWLKHSDSVDYRVFSIKVRLKGKDDCGYLWSELRLVVYLDDTGPVMAFGCISNINVKQLWQIELQHSAEHDVLTGFYNKVAYQKRVEEYLAKLTPRDLPPALLIIDADGFKAINDSFGHLFGDGVLADMGLAIRSNFKQNDIIGRIGGDEFIVLLCELPSLEVLDKRCNAVLKSLDRTYESNNNKLPFSVSIGVALYPEHGTSYVDLFKKADRALYDSKSRGKNCYSIYRSSLIGRSISVTSNRDPKHAEEMRQKAFQDNMLEFILNLFYETQNQDITISMCLGLFGKQFNLDRVAVDYLNRSSGQYTNAFEWLSPNGVSLRSNDSNIKDALVVRYSLINSMYKATPFGVMSTCKSTSQLGARYEMMAETLNLESFLYCKVSHGMNDIGCVGFETSSDHEFSKEEISRLSIFSVLLGNMLLNHRTDNLSERMSKHLQNILDHMQEFIYVVDKDTYEPIFFNMAIRQTLLKASDDEPCYKKFHNFDKPCEGCPLSRLSKHGSEYIDLTLKNWGVETSVRAYNIHWEDEQDKNLALIIQSSF